MGVTRRQFLKTSAVVGASAYLASHGLDLWAFDPVVDVDNPLDLYPNRDWEVESTLRWWAKSKSPGALPN